MFPLTRIGAGLPVADALPALRAACEASYSVVMAAPPGTGKTTLVPPALANYCAEWGEPGLVLVSTPRRVTTRAAAGRLAKLIGEELGSRVGYSIRGSHIPGSRIQWVTPGVLRARLMRDPQLEGVAAVILDEVHERDLDTDLNLGMLIELARLRNELHELDSDSAPLRLVAMSATVDAERFAKLMDAPVVTATAEIFPLEEHYQPIPGRFPGTEEFYRAVADLAAQQPEPTLVFVPGHAEVNRVVEQVRAHGVPAYPLHGGLTPQEQDQAFRPGHRVVVATPIAESSLTVPGITTVIDTGLVRSPRRDNTRGVQGLVTTSASRAATVQRAGRAARQGPGRAIFLYSQAERAAFPAYATPAILAEDLQRACLTLAQWGSLEVPLLDPMPARARAAAIEELTALGLIDSTGAITTLGRQAARLPLDPPLAAALISGGPDVSAAVAALAEPAEGLITTADLNTPLARQLSGLIAKMSNAQKVKTSPHPASQLATAALLAYPQRIARRVAGGGKTSSAYLLAGGSRVPAPEWASGHEWLVATELNVNHRNDGLVLRAAVAVTEEQVRALHPPVTEVELLESGDSLRAVEVTRIGAIELARRPVAVDDELREKWKWQRLAIQGIAALKADDAAQDLRARMAFAHAHLGEPWPAVTDELLVARASEIKSLELSVVLQSLLPWPAAANFDELVPAGFTVPSGRTVPISYPDPAALPDGRTLTDAEGAGGVVSQRKQDPTKPGLTGPTPTEPGPTQPGQTKQGSTKQGTATPTISVKLQECFGLAETPTIAGVRLGINLLSPAGRPLATSHDLGFFWREVYPQVRKEMRGRYPKHPWPEDPYSMPATAQTNRALSQKQH